MVARQVPEPSPRDHTVRFHGKVAGNASGPAAGPHTQMAQNILLSYVAGARILELKTVQVNDRLTIGRPCIDMTNVGYNIEWSQELLVPDSLREYVIGDDVRTIDWRGTARRADVVVRTFRPERDRRVFIVLDTSRLSAGRVGDTPRLDASIEAVLLLSALASRAGDRVQVTAFDREEQARAAGTGNRPRSNRSDRMLAADRTAFRRKVA